MKAKWTNLFWGLILIAAGALFLAQNLGYLNELGLPVWMVIFAVLSLLFFATYFVNGLGNWGWLFPACIFAALALVLWMTNREVAGSILGTPVLVGVGLPFLVAFALAPRRNWWALIPAWMMAVVAVITAFADRVQGEWVGALVLFSIGLPFLLVYVLNRQHWWALIPAWTMLVIGLVVLLSNVLAGEWVGAIILFAIGLPFLAVYLYNRQNWWALIPAWTLLVVGLVVLLSSADLQGEWVGVLVLLGIALPFFLVFFRSRQHWWALVPAGVLTSAALAVFLAGLVGEGGTLAKPGVLNGITFFGIALTFFILWLLRASQPTGWAIYAAGASALVALISLFFGAFDIAFPVAIILFGAVILLLALRPKKTV